MNADTNNRIIAIHQPNYIPWLGYYYKIYQSDIFVFLDDAQFSNQGMHNYTYIKTQSGPFRLKYPVKQSLGDKILDVHAKDELGWKEKHLSILQANYGKAEYFKPVFDEYRELLISISDQNIADLNIAIIKFFCKKLGINAEFIKSSELNLNLSKTEKIIAICKALGANVYYSGTGAKAYQTEEEFSANGIELKYSVFKPFQYNQQWEGFQSNVTALDYFMNCGYDWERVLKEQN